MPLIDLINTKATFMSFNFYLHASLILALSITTDSPSLKRFLCNGEDSIQKTTTVQTQKKMKGKEQNLRHYGITQKVGLGASVLEASLLSH